MNDYKELIGLLANPADGRDNADIMISAADAIEQLIKERDAAIADLKEWCDCDVCKNNNDECLNNGLCKKCSVGKSTRNYWEWRGVKDEVLNNG